MKDANPSITPEESLRIISETMLRARKNLSSGAGSFYLLFWGIIVGGANLTHFVLEVFTDYLYPYVVWIVIIPAAIASAIYGARKRKSAMVKTSIDTVYGQMWWFIFVIIIMISFGDKIGYNLSPVITLVTSLGIFVTGKLTNFKPLLIGSFALGLSSIIGFIVPYEYQTLVASIGILFGYVVPGYQLKKIGK